MADLLFVEQRDRWMHQKKEEVSFLEDCADKTQDSFVIAQVDNQAEVRGSEVMVVAKGAAGALPCSRVAQMHRTTKETDIALTFDLDGKGSTHVATGVAFFDHLLDAFGRHGLFDLTVQADGDIEVDAHHTVEDVGIVLGQAVASALGDKRGIVRYGSQFVVMDEALVLAACDISGRGQLHYDVALPIEMVGTFDTTLAKEFLIALAANAGITLHVVGYKGENSHHILEAVFKAVGRVLCEATALNPRIEGVLPSTKGSL